METFSNLTDKYSRKSMTEELAHLGKDIIKNSFLQTIDIWDDENRHIGFRL